MSLATGQPPREVLSRSEFSTARQLLAQIDAVFDQRLVGQQSLRASLVSSLLASGHVLLESVPGLAKTTAAHTLADAVNGKFARIQCTPDLMPNDIVGTQIFDHTTNTFSTQLGPVHANLVLLDEINRSSAKTQSAMLEAMQERQTSIGGVEHKLPDPFMVIATQNPIEEEGTYVLPEAQMDRFMIKVVLGYPDPDDEVEILQRVVSGAMAAPITAQPIDLDDVRMLRSLTDRVHIEPSIKKYVVDIINTTRGAGPSPVPDLRTLVRVGASPRGGIAFLRLAQASALMAGRDYVTPDDVRSVRYPVLRHRLVRTFEALADDVSPEHLVDLAFDAVPVP
ncbi:AAA family ATPase [Nocardioides limicola]|uniref:AAA family ATPase n=1 Tax=Nocardioides limicola TaxID=2803368 RepID=UPI00193B1630|nr:MoxR family ATPase [Nocardioides sp. DJM-14]